MAALLPIAAVGWAVGVLLGATPWTALGVGASTAALAVVLLAAWAGRSSAPGRLLAALLGLGVGWSAAGMVAASTVMRRAPAPCHVSRQTGRPIQRLQGRVLSEVGFFGGRRALVRASALARGGLWMPLCGNVELRLGAADPVLRAGDRVLLRGRLRRATGLRNPGVSGPTLRYRAADVGAVVYPRPGELVVLAAAPRGRLSGLRRELARGIDAALPARPSRAIIHALVLGDRSEIGPAQRRRFARAGTSHLLAVSGLHLGLVALTALTLLRSALRRLPMVAARWDARAPAALGAALVAIAYTLLTGAAPATARACVMCCALFGAYILGRSPDAARPLSLAALLLLVAAPLDLFRPGFQLSFAAVGAILLVHRRGRAAGPDPSPVRRALRWLRALAAMTLAATVATGPLVAHHFGEVSLVSVPANLIAVPLVAWLLLPLALLGAGTALVLPAVGTALLRLADALARVLDQLCAAVAALPGAALEVRPDWPTTALLLCLALGLMLGGRWRRRVVVGALLLLGALLGGRQLLAPTELEVTFLDVGQGDATFLRLPGGAAVLVDAGGPPRDAADPAASAVVRYLRARGVGRLDLLIATHPHADHVGGIDAVLRAVQVGELWACWHDRANGWLRAIRARARALGVPLRRPHPLRIGGVTLRPRWPRGAGGLCADPEASANDNSVVVQVRYGRASLLLAGDIERDAEAELVRRHGDSLRADLLKVPHHGSETSSSAALLQAVRPRLAVISCGADNRFRFPRDPTLRRYRTLGISVARIDRLGAVVARLGANGGLRWEPGYSPIP